MSYFDDTLPDKGSIADQEFMIWNRALLASERRLSIKVGEAEAQRVTAFDRKKRWVEGHATDSEGKIISDRGRISMYRLEGPVSVEIVPT